MLRSAPRFLVKTLTASLKFVGATFSLFLLQLNKLAPRGQVLNVHYSTCTTRARLSCILWLKRAFSVQCSPWWFFVIRISRQKVLDMLQECLDPHSSNKPLGHFLVLQSLQRVTILRPGGTPPHLVQYSPM
ncbi:hypothetical protein BJX66DRAFT_320623 [Aspergillus keveii]|uniref:Secreted protein n=1 Tax=Aspergillus keveii TaxID=714993 RepID=A0ABR4FGW8_9EURO